MGIISDIVAYKPRNHQEEQDKAVIFHFLTTNADAFHRGNTIAHMTASAWIVNPDRSKVLLCYHNIFGSWTWTGGHADGERDLLKVALKEAKEETGLENIRPVDGKILSLEVLTVDGHEKRGEYVSSHLHMNVTYMLEADDTEELKVCKGENSAVAWFSPEDALKASSEPWFVKRIYSKLIEATT